MARDTVRVTQVVFDLHGGGMESLVAAMAQRFAGGPIVMSVVTLSGRVGRVGEATKPFLDQFHVTRPLPVLSMVMPVGVARAIRATRPDVVHLHSGAWLKGALAARMAGATRVIFTEHGREHDDPPLMRWLDRRAAARTDTIVAVSDRLARYMVDVVGVDARHLRTIPNGVDTGAFTPGAPPDELRASLGIPPEALVLGSIGRLQPVKGYDRMIEAFARLRAAGGFERPVYLVLCGDGAERPRLEAMVARLGLAEAARLPGWTERPVDFYRLLDVFALTSHSEGMSVSLLEAMACGRTPVVMDVGANAELAGSELADQVVAADDVDGFVRTAAATLASASRRARAGSIARKRAVERYGLDQMLAAYEALYRGPAVVARVEAATP